MARLAALTCALVLGCGAASVSADGLVPVEGPWHATTSAGLPVSFEVKGGQVVNLRFRFRWTECGTFGSAIAGPAPIEPNGHWKLEDPRGQTVEGTFVAPDRSEGTVSTVERMTPGCLEGHATFVAEPGPAPPEPKTLVVDDVRSGHLAEAPRRMVLSADGRIRLYELDWYEFGERETQAGGRALLRRCRHCARPEVRRPPVTVRLDRRVEVGGHRVYERIRWFFRGHVPHGFAHQGSLLLE